MPVLDLSAYKPVPATLEDANQIANGFTAIQTCINGLDNNNFAAGKIFDPLKLMQDGASAGQALVWSAAANGGTGGWVPGTQAFAGASVFHSTNQTLTQSATTHIAWNSELYDVGGFHDNVTNNSRLTVPAGMAGFYLATVTIDVQTSATTAIDTLEILVNGVSGYTLRQHPEASASGWHLTGLFQMAVGDYLEAWYINGNVSPQTLTGSSGASVFSIMRLGS